MRAIHLLLFALFLSRTASAWEPPVVPAGLDAYREWDHWAYQRLGVRAYMRSTYDRRGGNEGADASHFLYQLAEDYNVTLDVAGPGILYFARYNHWHGSPWHYQVDGTDFVVQETSTANPRQRAANSIFLPETALPNPLTWTWSQTRGADLMWVPIIFTNSFQMAYSRTHYGTGYYIYHQFVRGTKLSQPLRAWDGQTPPSKDVLELIAKAGTDIAPQPAMIPVSEAEAKQAAAAQPGAKGGASKVIGISADNEPTRYLAKNPRGGAPMVDDFTGTGYVLNPGQSTLLANLGVGPAMIRKLEFSAPRAQAVAFGRGKLRITWDKSQYPSVDVPLALFFGAGTLYNRDNREYLVKAFPVSVHFDEQRVYLACYFPMPFFKSARIELIGPPDEVIRDVAYNVRRQPYRDPANHVGYFHANYQDFPHPEPGKDMVLLDTRATEGGGDWSGSFVGTSFIFSHTNNLTTLEGDPRFFFDDSLTPQAQGTGTEEWGGGGDYWGGKNMTLPFAGHPVGAPKQSEAKNEEDQIQSAYRFLLADLMPFGKNALIRLEHGGENQSTEHYETVAYWYGLPAPSLVQTDTLQIGNSASEHLHYYHSTNASEPYEITSRYEWGPDAFKGTEIYPASTDMGRKTTGSSDFTLKLEPKNFGVLLRRKLDYAFPNQRAEVYVAEARRNNKPPAESDWKPAGTWYLAGGNTCVYSNPKDELGAAQHVVQTSNRRFRDDEFLIPRDLTVGRSSICVRVKFTPVNIPLYPGQPVAELAWSEIRYDAYCYVAPNFKTP